MMKMLAKPLALGAFIVMVAAAVPLANATQTDGTAWKYTIKDENNEDTCFNTCDPSGLPEGHHCPCQVLPDIIITG